MDLNIFIGLKKLHLLSLLKLRLSHLYKITTLHLKSSIILMSPRVPFKRNYILKPYLVLLGQSISRPFQWTQLGKICLQINTYIYTSISHLIFPLFFISCTLSTVFLSPPTVFTLHVKYTICMSTISPYINVTLAILVV